MYVVRVESEDQAAVQNLAHEKPDDVVGVFSDPRIESIAQSYCGQNPVGNSETVAEKLGVSNLDSTGKDIRIAIVDTGIHADGHIKVTKGWSPPGVHVEPGHTKRDHGTMCAFDALIAAPDAQILDFALLQSTGQMWSGFLSDAVAAYAALIEMIQSEPGPLVVNNSWGIFDLSQDLPVGDPGNYSANPNHPFNQIVVSLIAAGAE